MTIYAAVFPSSSTPTTNRLLMRGKRGRAFCCDSARWAADLWRGIWREVDRRGGPQQVVLRWVKAHTGHGDARVVEALRRLNAHADPYAGEGAKLATVLVPNEARIAEYKRAVACYRYLERMCANWPVDFIQVREKPARAKTR